MSYLNKLKNFFILRNPFILALFYVLLMVIGLETIAPVHFIPFSVLVTSIFFVVTYYYYNQKVYLENKEKLLMPGEWIAEINKNSEIINEQHNSHAELQEMIYNFKDILISKEEQIQRYQQGYDYKIYKNFLVRFIKISRLIEKCKGQGDEDLQKKIKNISFLFEDAMEEYGIEIIPENLIIGKPFTELGALVQDGPTKISTSNNSEDGIVCEIDEDGYKLIDAETLTVIIPAKVTVKKYDE